MLHGNTSDKLWKSLLPRITGFLHNISFNVDDSLRQMYLKLLT
jgi:hypothetical protein